MPVRVTGTSRLLELAKKRPILRVRNLATAKIHPEHFRRLWAKGVMERTSRGVYRLVGAEYTAHLSLAEVAKRVPHGVICLVGERQGSTGDRFGGGEGGQEVGLNSRGSPSGRAFF